MIKNNLGMTCRLNDCPLCSRRKAIIWPNVGRLVGMKTSEMEIPRAEEKAKLKQVGLACLYFAIGTEIMGPM